MEGEKGEEVALLLSHSSERKPKPGVGQHQGKCTRRKNSTMRGCRQAFVTGLKVSEPRPMKESKI